MSATPTRTLTLAELPEQRRKTIAVSDFLRNRIAGHLETLQPLLAPERVLGKFASGKAEVPGAERALADLQKTYQAFTASPYELSPNFDPHWLTLVGQRIELHPWEYAHEARSERESKSITITSPLRWIVNYSANCSLAQFKQELGGRDSRRLEKLRQFVVNALVLQQVVAKTTGLPALLSDLRLELKIEQAPGIPKLPLVVISSLLPSYRPADDLVLAAAAFSGVTAFVELIDLDQLNTWPDSLKANIELLVNP